ncbi:MAG TPA: PLDc N-terminal domain-containing protein [Ohtaekwangia sp.]|nr:PLDc N-terminal domain-containing protein [Ohtaekwangia sp.]
MIRIIPILIIIIQVIAIVDVVKSARDTERKVLWILAIVLLPILGSLAWYVVSRNIIRF